MSDSEQKSLPGGKFVVVAVDGSPMSKHAVEWAARVLSEKDHLRLLHVQTPSEHHDEIHEVALVGPLYHVGQEISEESIQIISGHLKQCRELGVTNFKEDVVTQRVGVAKSIISYVQEIANSGQALAADILLVIGSRELGFFEKAFLGSVSDYCLHNSPCPVLVTKLPKTL